MFSRALLSVTLAVTVPACVDFERGPRVDDTGPSTPTGGGGGDGGEGASFAGDAHPVLMQYCHSCHQTSGSAQGASWLLTGDPDVDYAVTSSVINTANPADSRLLRQATGLGHTGGTIITTSSSAYETLIQWIEAGASP